MARKYVNFFDTGLLSGVSSATGASAQLGSAPPGAVVNDTYRLVFDPLAEFGAPEVVDWRLSSGTTGTLITRSLENTVARSHQAGTRVILALTSGAPEFVGAAQLKGDAIAPYFVTRVRTSNANVPLTAFMQNVADTEFIPPAGWGQYEALVTTSGIRTNGLPGDVDYQVSVVGGVSGTTTTTLPVGRFTGLSGTKTIAVQARNSNGGNVFAATFSALFTRTS